MRILLMGITSLAVVLLLPAVAGAKPKLKADYRFEGNFKSAAGHASTLKPEGPLRGCPPCAKFKKSKVKGKREGVWQWPEGDGLRLNKAGRALGSNLGDYTFVLLVNLDNVDGYRKLIDFDNLQSDDGLYIDDGTFYPYDLDYSSAVIGAGSWHQVVMTRNASGQVKGFFDGKQVLSVADPDPQQVIGPDRILHFLIDDTGTTGEQSGGMIARLRIFDRPLSPSTVKHLGG